MRKALFLAALYLLAPTAASAATFPNSAPIAIPDSILGAPYPSSVAVSGQVGPVTTVSVTIFGFTHESPGDVGILLMGPNGEALVLEDCLGAAIPIAGVTYTVADAGPTQLPGDTPWPPGVYKPRSDCLGTVFPFPGPGTAYANPGPEGGGVATFASTFAGDDPNGAWHLFVLDHDPGGIGSIAGWSLFISPEAAITKAPPKKTKKKSVTIDFVVSQPGTAECSVDGGPFAPCVSPFKATGKKKGRHTVTVRGVDATGNLDGSPATAKWKRKKR